MNVVCLPTLIESRVYEEAAYRAPIHSVTDDDRRNTVAIAQPY